LVRINHSEAVEKWHKNWIKKRGIIYAELKGGFNGERRGDDRRGEDKPFKFLQETDFEWE
jgi:hypothetical protein